MAAFGPRGRPGRFAGMIPMRVLPAGAWIAAYTALVALPLLILLQGAPAKGGGFWWDFAMALGFGGLGMLGLQSVLTARFRRATAPFGIDIIYYFHRLAAIAGAGLVAGHYLILRVSYAGALGSLDPRAAPWHMTAGRAAAGLFVLLIVTSVWRQPLKIEYDRWRFAHAAMAVAAVSLAIAHIWGVGHYTANVWRGLPWILFSAVWVLVVFYVRIGRPWTILREPYRVAAVRKERGRAWTLTLKPDGHIGMTFRPGQFAWLVLRVSPFRAKEHPFSFSGCATGTNTLEFTVKELGDYTRTIGATRVGELAYVDGPHGMFTTDRHPDAPGFVFVAGGIGIAPIMSMLRTLAQRGDRRPLWLVYGNGRWENVVFREELEALVPRLNLVVTHVLQHPPPGWTGASGILTEPVTRAALPAGAMAAEFFVCGPKAMSNAVQRTLRAMGVPMRRIHCELFDLA